MAGLQDFTRKVAAVPNVHVVYSHMTHADTTHAPEITIWKIPLQTVLSGLASYADTVWAHHVMKSLE